MQKCQCITQCVPLCRCKHSYVGDKCVCMITIRHCESLCINNTHMNSWSLCDFRVVILCQGCKLNRNEHNSHCKIEGQTGLLVLYIFTLKLTPDAISCLVRLIFPNRRVRGEPGRGNVHHWPHPRLCILFTTATCKHDYGVVIVLSHHTWAINLVECQFHCHKLNQSWLIVNLMLILYALNFSEERWTYIYILCHYSTLIWHRYLKSFLK